MMIAVILIVVVAAWITGFYRITTLFLDDYNAHHPDLEEFRMAYEMCDGVRKGIIIVIILAFLFIMAPYGLLCMITGKHP